MDIMWLFPAYLFGIAARLINLPPLVGYLVAGFILNYLQLIEVIDPIPLTTLRHLAEMGITLMLFTIGLKIHPSDLVKTEIIVPALSHMLIWVLLVAACIKGLGVMFTATFGALNTPEIALVAFLLSFSSTVCVVKLLESSGEIRTRHGQIAIGILVIQDIAAVIFLVLATGKTPHLSAFALLLLLPLRPFMGQLLDKSGHGELLPLVGLVLAFGGQILFEHCNIKGDLGALVMGMLLSQHAKAGELAKSLLTIKDVMLIGFFLLIGFAALPNAQILMAAAVIGLLLPLKFSIFFILFSGAKLRGRTSFLTSLVLNNFSEFALIVALLATEKGWLTSDWLVILALSITFSFIYTNIWYQRSHNFYTTYKHHYRMFERKTLLPEDQLQQPEGAEILLIGMGRVGRGAYNALHQQVAGRVWGMDADTALIRQLQEQHMNVFCGDAESADLWENLDISQVRLILMATPSVTDSINIAKQIRQAKYRGELAAIARYEDERDQLINAGIDNVFNFFAEAGAGFAEESLNLIAPPEDNRLAASQS